MAKRNKKIPSRDHVVRAKMARGINWNVVNNWRERLGAKSNFEMVIDFDNGTYYSDGRLKVNSPFQSHVRKNIEHMMVTGIMNQQDQIDYLKEFKKAGGTLQMLTKSMDDEDYGS